MGSLNDLASQIFDNAFREINKLRGEMVARHKGELDGFDKKFEAAKSDLASLDRMAREIPAKFFDRYAAMYSCEFDVDQFAVDQWKSRNRSVVLSTPVGTQYDLHPMFGQISGTGRYRVIALVEKVS